MIDDLPQHEPMHGGDVPVEPSEQVRQRRLLLDRRAGSDIESVRLHRILDAGQGIERNDGIVGGRRRLPVEVIRTRGGILPLLPLRRDEEVQLVLDDRPAEAEAILLHVE